MEKHSFFSNENVIISLVSLVHVYQDNVHVIRTIASGQDLAGTLLSYR